MRWFAIAEALDEFLEYLLLISAGASIGIVFMLIMGRL